MSDLLYAMMGIPDTCFIGQRVYKKHFYDRARLTGADKKALSEDVELITWRYSLKASTIAIAPYEDGIREYEEIAFLHVDLRSPRRIGRLADIIHKAIPYPVVIVFQHDPGESDDGYSGAYWAISVAPKRLNQSGGDGLVVEEVLTTAWMAPDVATPWARGFLHHVRLQNLPQNHFYELYTAMVDRIRALAWAEVTEHFTVASTEAARERQRERMDKYRALEAEVARLRATMKRETQFNRKVELNMKIKQLDNDMQQLIARSV